MSPDYIAAARRTGLVLSIADKEAELSERFDPDMARELAVELVDLRNMASTPEQRREAREAIDEYNANAREFGLEVIR